MQRDECESDVTEAYLSCCSQSVNVFCLLICLSYFVCHQETTFSFGGDDVVGKHCVADGLMSWEILYCLADVVSD